MAWLDFWGAYMHTGYYNNVALVGSPNDVLGRFNANLTQAHQNGYGYGIQFSQNDNGTIHVDINLVGISVGSSGQAVYGQHYVQYGGRYNYKLTIWTSNNNQSSWNTVYSGWVFSHGDTWYLAYAGNWTQTAQCSQWSGNINIADDTTHVMVNLTGEQPVYDMSVVYTIDQVITEYRPWAVRKNGKFLSCNRKTGFTRIRKKENDTLMWTDIEKMTEGGQTNKGTSRIRHTDWKGQKRVGEM